MTLADLKDRFDEKRRVEAAKGWDGLDGVAWFGYGIPAPPFLSALADDALALLGIHLDEPGVLAVGYLGEGSHPACIIGPSFQTIVWRKWQPAKLTVPVHHVSGLLQLGDAGELRVLGHLLAYAAGYDVAVDRGALREAP
jgi:hypothetical protein